MIKVNQITIVTFLIIAFELMNVSISKSQPIALPYELKPGREVVFLSIGLPLSLSPFYVKSTRKFLDVSEIDRLNADNVNIFDKWVIYNWSLQMRKTSKTLPYVAGGIGAASILLMPAFTDKSRPHLYMAGTLAVMYTEGILISQGLSFMMNTYINRPKPYVYNTNIPIELRVYQGNNASFFSKRTCFTFYTALFTTMTVYDMFPQKPAWIYVGAGLYGLAGLTAAAELSSGEHFYTDVLTGIAVGTATAYAVIKFHRIKNTDSHLTLLPAIGTQSAGIYLNYRFY